MPEYAKMKNIELEALLKERGLPHGGKKADMVERLQKDDEKTATPAESKAANAEDEIDWDDEGDDAVAASASKDDKPAAASEKVVSKAGGVGQASNTQATDPAKPKESSVPPPTDDANKESTEAKAEEKQEPAVDYSIGLAATNLDEEIEKRKKRALKFGTKIEDDEGLKKLERAKKFGEVGPPRGLDEALPERTRKRGREEGGEDVNGTKRRGGGRGGSRGGRGGRDGRDGRDRRDNKAREGRDTRKDDSKTNSGSGWMSEKDKAAADARKAKWANPAA